MRSGFAGKGGRRGLNKAGPLLLLTMAAGVAGHAQRTFTRATGYHVPDSRAAVGPVHIVREISDPHTGAQWLILPNAENPAGPGRAILGPEAGWPGHPAWPENAAPPPVIHRGDRLVIEEHSPVAEAYLEGVALGPARAGSSLEVRLKIGGMVVRAVAIAPGRATFAPAPEVRR